MLHVRDYSTGVLDRYLTSVFSRESLELAKLVIHRERWRMLHTLGTGDLTGVLLDGDGRGRTDAPEETWTGVGDRFCDDQRRLLLFE